MDETTPLPRSIELEDVYRFKGLPKAVTEDDLSEGSDYFTERLITVLDISVTGKLAIRVDVDGVQGDTLQDIPLSEAEYLVQQGVWEFVNDWER